MQQGTHKYTSSTAKRTHDMDRNNDTMSSGQEVSQYNIVRSIGIKIVGRDGWGPLTFVGLRLMSCIRPKECTERSGTVVLVISFLKIRYVFMVVSHMRENSQCSVSPIILSNTQRCLRCQGKTRR